MGIIPYASVPLDILKKLSLTHQDNGVDGVLETILGEFNVYQVKFRTGRPSLTLHELSTFIAMADSPRIHNRVLLTNCDELSAKLNERQGFFCIRGADFDRMEADEFRAIEAWLADAACIASKKTPKDHQTEALDSCFPRCKKTTEFPPSWPAERAKRSSRYGSSENVALASPPASSCGVPAAKILVLLPSLALLRQTLHEWLPQPACRRSLIFASAPTRP